MKVTVLGSGTSTGIPVLGCDCSVCLSPSPLNKRLRTSCVLAFDDGSNIVIDTTPDFRTQCLTFGVKRVDAVLYTHAHADHILGLEDLRGFNFRASSAMPIFGTEKTLQEIKRFFNYLFDPDPNYLGGKLTAVAPCIIEEGIPFQVRDVTVTPIPLKHGRMDVLGFRIGNTAYLSDCNLIPEPSYELLKGVEVLFLDGLRFEPHRTHFTIPEAIEAAQKIGARETFLIHMTHNVDHDIVDASLPKGVRLAYDGLTVECG